jgi:hydrogenase nickel incorporation protein HypA/HybF
VHEISIVTSLFEIIDAEVERQGIAAISKVYLKMGELAQLEPMTLTACFELVAEGTAAQGAELVIEILPVIGSCAGCGSRFRIVGYRFSCPDCGRENIELVGGKELYLDSLEVTTKGEGHETIAA